MFRDALTTVSEHPPQLLDIAQLTARVLPVSFNCEREKLGR
jgi:hypothetical protein